MSTTRKQIFETFLKTKGISTDTRTTKPGDVFFALKGDRFNGNLYAQKALEAGAALVVIDEAQNNLDPQKFALVDDALMALQELAQDYRKTFTGKVIGLTGSNGKTTCKELFNAVLSKHFTCHATLGNLNNHIGVPLTLLSAPQHAEVVIVEMGANHQGEIARLCEIAMPDLGYITHFGRAHLEGFGGVEGIIKGKTELYQFLKKNRKTALINQADATQMEKSEGIKRFVFGETDLADVKIENISKNTAAANVNGVEIVSQLTGAFHFSNVASAIALGVYLDVNIDNIKSGIESYAPKMNRSEWRKTEKNELFMDAYNANPDSMLAAIEMFAALNKPNKWYILGDMFELGNYEHEEHQRVVDFITEKRITHVVLVGAAFAKTNRGPEKTCFSSTPEAEKHFQKLALSGATILLKGSRGMHLETITPYL